MKQLPEKHAGKTLTAQEREDIREQMPQHIPHTPWRAIQEIRKQAPKSNLIGRLKRQLLSGGSHRQHSIDIEPLLKYNVTDDLQVIGKPFQGFFVFDYAEQRRTKAMKLWHAVEAALKRARGQANAPTG